MVVIEALSVLTLLADALLVLAIPLYILRNRFQGVWEFVHKHRLWLSFIIALLATSGSLFFSEIANLVPCELCWYIRIMMYPQVIILGAAILTKGKEYGRYVIPLSALGAVIAGYNYGIQIFSAPSFCSATEVSCSSYSFMQFGYITIATMALTAFLMILVLNAVKPEAHK